MVKDLEDVVEFAAKGLFSHLARGEVNLVPVVEDLVLIDELSVHLGDDELFADADAFPVKSDAVRLGVQVVVEDDGVGEIYDQNLGQRLRWPSRLFFMLLRQVYTVNGWENAPTCFCVGFRDAYGEWWGRHSLLCPGSAGSFGRNRRHDDGIVAPAA